jgi:hypothetical protein
MCFNKYLSHFETHFPYLHAKFPFNDIKRNADCGEGAAGLWLLASGL